MSKRRNWNESCVLWLQCYQSILYTFWITPFSSVSQINEFYLHVVIFTTVLCGARAWVMLALTHILGSVIRLSDFRMNKYLISSWITRDHLFVKKNPTRHLLLIKLMNGNYPPTEFPFDFIIIYCEILFKKSYPISLHEKRNY